jgi:hypothetical protein
MDTAETENLTPNTITFSADMTLLYLIDSGRAIPFALNKRNGVLLTVLRDQITVVSAPVMDLDKEEAAIPESAKAVVSGAASRSAASIPILPQKLTLPVAADNQITVIFNRQSRALVVIGVTDIDGALQEERQPDTLVSLFSLEDRIVNIRRVRNRIEFLSIRL